MRPEPFGSRFSSGTKTSSITISPVGDARTENLPSILRVVSPFMPRSSMKPRMTPPSSFAHTTMTSAIGACVIQSLVPVST